MIPIKIKKKIIFIFKDEKKKILQISIVIIKDKKGPKKKKKLNFFNNKLFLKKNFKPSKIGWIKPKNMFLLGPKRNWINPINLRSIKV